MLVLACYMSFHARFERPACAAVHHGVRSCVHVFGYPDTLDLCLILQKTVDSLPLVC